MAEYTSLSIEIIKPGEEEDGKEEREKASCSLSIEINSEDNGGKSSFIPGETGIARVFSGSGLEGYSVKNTNGSVSSGGSAQAIIGEDDGVFITFSGGTTASASYAISQIISSEVIGGFFDIDGDPFSPAIKILPDDPSVLVANKKCYGIIKITYRTTYDKWVFSLNNENDGLLVATGDCGTEKIFATANISAYVEGDSEDEETEEEKACGLTLEMNSSDNGGNSSIGVGDTGTVRLYKGEDVSISNVVNTNGSISKSGSSLTGTVGTVDSEAEDDDKIYVSFSGSKTASLQYRCVGNFQYVIQGSFYDSTGKSVNPSFSASGTTVTANTECLGVLLVSYTTEYDTYDFGANDPGTIVLGAFGTCGGNNIHDSLTVSVSSESVIDEDGDEDGDGDGDGSDASDSISMAIDVTLVYKDFVSGDRIPGAQIKLDGSPKGETDDNGEIVLKGLKTHTRDNIVATKEGYLSTDSDSLSNDSFYIST